MKHKILIGVALLTSAFLMAACDDDDDYSVGTERVVKSITTGDATVTAISAVITGTVSDLSKLDSERYKVGTVYGTSGDPTKSGTYKVGSIDEQGNVTTALTNLTEGTTYYYATYVTLQSKVTEYGEVKSFIATDADVATAAATGIGACHATFNGQATGVGDILDKVSAGFKYSTSADGVEDGIDLPLDQAATTLTLSVKGLLPGTTYHYAAYAKVGDSVIFGNTQTFTTAPQEMEYVDMGTSVLWAKCNIGAETESETGILVGFGDQTFYSTSLSDDDYTPWDIAGTDEDIINNLSIDGDATKKSCTPTAAQMTELISKTTQTVATVDGVAGIRFTAKNGNSIFLPYTGYRSGANVTADGAGYYWTGTVSEMDETLAKSLKVSQGAGVAFSARHLGLAVRSVREEEPVSEGITVRNYNGVQGDIEGNGNFRFDIYNQWDGSNTGSDETSVLIPSEVVFSESLSVTFTISGTQGKSCNAYMCFADGSWTTQNWGYNESGEASCTVSGDGTYTMTIHGSGSNLGVFALDFVGLTEAVGSADGINVKIEKVVPDDWGTKLPFDNSKLVSGDIEGNGNFRADIYNQWDGSGTGSAETCGVDIDAVVFSSRIGVTFSVEGTQGGEFQAKMTFADNTWTTQNWEYNEDGSGSCLIKGDGTYTMALSGSGSGLGVFAVDIIGLGEAVGADNVKVRIASIRVE